MMMNRKGEEGDIYSERYLTIEALEDGLTVSFDNDGLEYCIDGCGEWVRLSLRENTEVINNGHKLHFRSNIVPEAEYGIGTFDVNKHFNVMGNAMSLLFGDEGYLNNSLEGKKGALKYLFYQCDKLKNVSPNLLPATTLSDACYANMFEGCDGLITPPELPAVNLTYECYYCMFAACNSITIAPILPATTLAEYCYEGMFQVCRNLNYIKMLATDISADGCMDYWTYSVAYTGTFVKNSDATWDVRGENGIPDGWAVKFDGEEESGSPYDFSFNIIATDDVYEANAEDLAILNKGLEIIMQIAEGNLGGFVFSHETAPPEFDLRINGIRNFNFNFFEYSTYYMVYTSFTDGITLYFGQEDIQKSNPVFETFVLYKA